MDEYKQQAQDFLNKHGLKVAITYLDNEPPQWQPKSYQHNHYRVKVTRISNGKSVTWQFWDSIANTEKGERPNAYDVLASVSSESYVYNDFEEFCSVFGYSNDSIKALKTWKAYNKLSKRLNRFFSETELEDLREIQ